MDGIWRNIDGRDTQVAAHTRLGYVLVLFCSVCSLVSYLVSVVRVTKTAVA